jgi:hypothetical protein
LDIFTCLNCSSPTRGGAGGFACDGGGKLPSELIWILTVGGKLRLLEHRAAVIGLKDYPPLVYPIQA